MTRTRRTAVSSRLYGRARYRIRAALWLGWLAVMGWTAPAPAQIIRDAVPGGLVEIPLVSLNQERPDAFFGQHRVLVTEFGSRWVGLVGLPLDIVPGTYVIQARIDDSEDMIIREFTVYPRRITSQPVVKLPKFPLDNPGIELKWRGTLDAELPMAAPVFAPARPVFGRYRQVSDDSSSYVEFVTFRIGTDSSVVAPDNGQVAHIVARETGTYIWIDHGMGLFTCMGPVTRTTLKASDTVQAGQSIGKIVLDTADNPGLLYWSVYLNGFAINPSLISDIEVEQDGESRPRGRSG